MRTFLRVFRWLKRYYWLSLAQLACAVCVTILILVLPSAAAGIIDKVIRGGRPDLLLPWTIAAAAAVIGQNLLNGVRIVLNNILQQNVIFDIRSEMHARLQSLPLPWFEQRPTGDLMTTVAEDVTALERVLRDGMEQGLLAFIQLTVVSFWLFSMQPNLAAISMIPMPLLAGGALYYTLTARGRFREVRRVTSELNSVLHDNISGIRQIKTYGMESSEHERFNTSSDRVRRATWKITFSWAIYSPAMSLVSASGTVLVLFFGGRAVLEGSITAGEFTGFALILPFFYEPVGRLHQINQIFQAGRAAAERVFHILDATPEENARQGTPLRVTKGHLMYRDVRFTFAGGRATLEGVTLEARPGEMVAIVGPTGAGKSTVINLLSRFYEPDSGIISVDGQDIRGVSKPSLRAAIGYVTQESFMFNGTVRDNLLLAKRDATESDLWAALEAANARAFVERLPDKLDTPVGERGTRLSGGEKQRLSIARVLLKNPPIILLDEATASVDNETERLIQKALERLMANRTAMVVAHRLSTVRHADRIYVLSHGKIVEEGTHDDLAEGYGLYAELCRGAFLNETREPALPAP
jgi:ATP-binding cassette subfamily B protein